jgi:hypothetical protein
VGRYGDGGKWVCDPDCLLTARECTVFSVGSNNDFSFEEAMAVYGCRMHTFDHTVARPMPPAFVTFHSVGLAGVNGSDGNVLLTLRGAAARANLDASTVIDVLKIDCEGCEFDVFGDAETLSFLKSNVKQILIEVHYRTESQMVRLAENLRDAGFKTFSKEPNIQWSDGSCVEYGLINVHL